MWLTARQGDQALISPQKVGAFPWLPNGIFEYIATETIILKPLNLEP
jgi:hypothetical protein